MIFMYGCFRRETYIRYKFVQHTMQAFIFYFYLFLFWDELAAAGEFVACLHFLPEPDLLNHNSRGN